MNATNVIPFRSRGEVSRAVVRLPPKSRRRYKREGGPRYRDVGRFQKPARWYVMGKVILPDLRPCWRCTLGADACATCTNPRRAKALETGEAEERGSDRTADRIRAFLGSMRPLNGVEFSGELEESQRRGRSLVEHLARSADDSELPALRLTAEQCADVLAFMSTQEPVEPASWWTEPAAATSHVVGYCMILEALAASLRAQRGVQDHRGRLGSRPAGHRRSPWPW